MLIMRYLQELLFSGSFQKPGRSVSVRLPFPHNSNGPHLGHSPAPGRAWALQPARLYSFLAPLQHLPGVRCHLSLYWHHCFLHVTKVRETEEAERACVSRNRNRETERLGISLCGNEDVTGLCTHGWHCGLTSSAWRWWAPGSL